MRAQGGQGASAWLTMAQTWLELAQVAERRESAPAGDALPVTGDSRRGHDEPQR